MFLHWNSLDMKKIILFVVALGTGALFGMDVSQPLPVNSSVPENIIAFFDAAMLHAFRAAPIAIVPFTCASLPRLAGVDLRKKEEFPADFLRKSKLDEKPQKYVCLIFFNPTLYSLASAEQKAVTAELADEIAGMLRQRVCAEERPMAGK